jgi:hypothetical protein
MAIEMARLQQTSAAQSIPFSADTKINFDTIGFDTTSGRMASLANDNLTVSTSGSYLLTGCVRFANTNSSPLNYPAPGAVIKATTNQNVANNTDTQVDFTVTLWDTSQGAVMADTANNRIITLKQGIYYGSVSCRWSGGGSGQRYLSINANGGRCFESDINAGAGATSNSCGGPMLLAAGQVVDATAFQNSGGTTNMDSSLGTIQLGVVGPIDSYASQRYISIWKNGNTALRTTEGNMYVYSDPGSVSVSTICSLVQGDTIDLRAFQVSSQTAPGVGSALNTDIQFGDIHLSMALLSPQ